MVSAHSVACLGVCCGLTRRCSTVVDLMGLFIEASDCFSYRRSPFRTRGYIHAVVFLCRKPFTMSMNGEGREL